MNRFITSSILLTTFGFSANSLLSSYGNSVGRPLVQIAQQGNGFNSFNHMKTKFRLVTSCAASSTSISDLRKEYSKQGLSESEVPSDDPFELFEIWFEEARNANVLEPNAMVGNSVSIEIFTFIVVLTTLLWQPSKHLL
jgi:hypothetical protein